MQPLNLQPPTFKSTLPRPAVPQSKFRASARVNNAGTVDLLLFDVIGDEEGTSTAGDVAQFLREHKGMPVNVRINSMGGLLFDGLAIFNALVSHDAPVTTTIEGVAASAASLISLAGNPARMRANAMTMIHRANLIVVGNTADMRAAAEFLQQCDDRLTGMYADRTGKSNSHIRSLMVGNTDGTWFTPEEALSLGLVDTVLPMRSGSKATNHTDLPADVRARLAKLAQHEADAEIAELRKQFN